MASGFYIPDYLIPSFTYELPEMSTTTGRTTVTMSVELHRRVFGENGMKPYESMSNAEFLEELADTYERVHDL